MLAFQANVDVNAAVGIPATTMASNARHVVNMANSIVGVSILSVPYCFKETGLVLGMLTVLTCGFITKKTSMFLIRSAMMTRRRSYEFLAFHVFGVSGKLFVELCMILFLIGICISFHVVMGDLAPAIIAKVFSIENTPALRCTLLIGVAVLIILPLCLLRNLDSLSSMSATSIGFYFFLVSVILIHALPKLLDGSWLHTVELWKPKGLLQVFPIISLALACQSNVFEIYDSLPDPDVVKMRTVVAHAVNLCCGLYIAVGFLGYVAFADKDFGGNIVMSFPGSELTEFIKLFFAVSLAISFPLMIFPCRTSIHSLLYRRNAQTSFDLVGNYMPEARFKGITLGILTISLVIGIMIPNIEFVLGLLGSTMGMTIALILPSLMFIKVNSKATTERLVAQAIMFIGAFLIVTGTYLNAKNISDSDISQKPVIAPDLSKQSVDSPDIAGNAFEKNVDGLVLDRAGIVEDKPLRLEKGQQISNKLLEDDPGKKITDSATRKEPVAPEPPPDINEKVKAVAPVKEAVVEVAANKVVKDIVQEEPKEKEVVNVEEKSSDDDLHPDAIEKEEKENKEEKQREDEEKEKFEKKQDTILQKIEEQNKQQEEILAQQKKILEELKKSKDQDVEGRRQEDQPQAKRVESVAAPAVAAVPSMSGVAPAADINVGGGGGQMNDQIVSANMAPGFQQGVPAVQSQAQYIQPVAAVVQKPLQAANVQPVMSVQNPVQPNIVQQPVVAGVQNSVPSNNMQPVISVQNPHPNQASAQQVHGNQLVQQNAFSVPAVQNSPKNMQINWNNPQQSLQNMYPNQGNLQNMQLDPQSQLDLQNSPIVQQSAPAQSGVAEQPAAPVQPDVQMQPGVQVQPGVSQGVPVQLGAQIHPGILVQQGVLSANPDGQSQPMVKSIVPDANTWNAAAQAQYIIVSNANGHTNQANAQHVRANGPANMVNAQASFVNAQADVQVAQSDVNNAQAKVHNAQVGVPNAVSMNAQPEYRNAALANPGIAAEQVPVAAAASATGQGLPAPQVEVGQQGAKQPDKLPEVAKMPSSQVNIKPVINHEQPNMKIDSPYAQEQNSQKKDVKPPENADQKKVSKSNVQTKSSSVDPKASKVDGSSKSKIVSPNSVKTQGSIPEVDKSKKKEKVDFNKLGNGPVMNHLQNKGNVREPSKTVVKEAVAEKKKKVQQDDKKNTAQKEDQKKNGAQKEGQNKKVAQKEDQNKEVAQKEGLKKKVAQKDDQKKRIAKNEEEQKKQLAQKEKEQKLAQKEQKKVAQHDEERKKRGALLDDLGDINPSEEQNEVPENNPYHFNLPKVDLNRDLKRRSVGELSYDTRHLLWNQEDTDRKYKGRT